MSSPPPSSGSEAPKDGPAQPQETSVKKPNIIKRLWVKTGLTPVIVLLMLKGALSPIIALAAYQSDAWAREYTTLGYLAAIMAMLSLPIMPRAKFIQSMITGLLFTCTGAAISLLQILCTVTARKNTTEVDAPTAVGSSGSSQSVEYNASASTTACVWLFITIWIGNIVRAYRPQLMLPVIQYCIFTVVSSTYAPQFPDMAAGESFVRRLLIVFLTGFGISTGVSLFIFPMTSRQTATAQVGGLMGSFKAILTTHGSYMQTIADSNTGDEEADKKGVEQAKKLRGLVTQVGQLYAKMKLELSFARKEVAWGKWGPEDFSDVFRHLTHILLPSIGLCTFLDIMHAARVQAHQNNDDPESTETLDAMRRLETEEWNEVLAMSHQPYLELKKSLVQGLDHVCYVLEITKKPKQKKKDIEEKADAHPMAGDDNFAAYLEGEVHKFHVHRETVIQRWCKSKGIELPTAFWESSGASTTLEKVTTAVARKKENQHQLYLILYIEFLVYSIGKAIVAMVKYADSKLEDGTMKRSRLVTPGWRRIRKLMSSIYRPADSDNVMGEHENDGAQIWVGDSLKRRRDPEHLAAVTAYEKLTDYLRAVPRLLSSPEAGFAFRATVATISIGIIAYFRQTWLFFLQQRGLWSLIMVAISMGAHAGQGLFGFAARILGTVVAMIASIVIWYIGYNTPGAILLVFYIYLLFGFWFMIKNPNYTIVGMISMVTAVLIIGYELQAKKIGRDVATSNGQPFYEIYLLAPYRLVAVVIGLAAAFFWTYFPYPITTHSTLRKELGDTLYLLANYYSVVHSTIETRLHRGQKAKSNDKTSPLAKLDKARLKVLQKTILMLGRLREHSHFTKFEPKFGGKFPRDKYDDLIARMTTICQYLSLIAYSADSFVEGEDSKESVWLTDFRRFTSEVNLTSHEITSTLCLVSASVRNSQPLPPYLHVPAPYAVATRIESVDPEILSVEHVAEPCYAAFAVLEVASTLLTEEMSRVIRIVQDLVGEVDFSFHVVSTNSDNVSTDSTIWGGNEQTNKGKND